MRNLVVCAILLIFVAGACDARRPEATTPRPPEPATNVILLIGDGMGGQIIGLAKDYARVLEERELWIERTISEGHLALVHMPSLGKLVADSAAAATALATGEKTANGAVSVTAWGSPLTTILELARNDSRSTGLVSTTNLTHATPACFAAHVKARDLENEIAEQLLGAGVDVMMGGGLAHWIPEGKAASDFARFSALAGAAGKSSRKDEINLLDKAIEAGYQVVTNREELLAGNKAEKTLGLFGASHLLYAIDRRPDDAANVPSLAEMTAAAIDILSKNEKGFFLMVEGGRIDHAAHSNDVATMIAEMIDFDDAIGVAYAFAKKGAGTVIFIAADHTTGAPCLSARYSEQVDATVYPDDSALRKISRQDASFEYLVRSLAGKPSVAELKRLVSEHTGIEISEEDAMFIMKAGPVSPFHIVKPKYREFGYPALAMGRVLGIEYGIAWATAEHYGAPVLLAAYGARADLVHGYIENTDIFRIMKTAGGL